MNFTGTPARLTLQNIAYLCRSAYDASRNATKRIDPSLEMISYLNHQEIKDEEIAKQLCNIHLSPVCRAEAIERRAYELLRRLS
jgi:hypothetical protein